MAKPKTLRTAALVLGMAGAGAIGLEALASCGSTAQTPAPDAGAPVHIGVVIALTGDLSGTGSGLQNAVRVAEQQLNAYGGILGRHVSFDIQDDKTQSGAAIQGVVSGLLDQHVSALLGPIGSQQVLDVQGLTYAAKTIEISATATSVLLTDAQPDTDRYLFRTVPNDTLQAKALAIFAYNGPAASTDAGFTEVDSGAVSGVDGGDAGVTPPPAGGACRKMAIIHSNDDYGAPFAAALVTNFEDPLRAGPGAVVVNVPVPANVKANYTAELDAVQTAKPDCLAILTFDPSADEIVSEIRQRQGTGAISPNLLLIGVDGNYTQNFIVNGQAQKGVAASPSVAEGVFGTNPDSNPGAAVSGYGDFRNLYLSQFALDPGATDLPGQAANFYDAAILAALAIERAGTADDPVKIRDSLFAVSKGATPSPTVVGPGNIGDALNDLRQTPQVDINYEGASGSCDFNTDGDVVGDYIIWKVVHVAGQAPAFQTVGTVTAKSLQGQQ